MLKRIAIFAFAVSSLITQAARADGDRPLGALEVSLKAGGHFPQLTNPLDSALDGVLKVGYGVTADRRLQLFADLAYSSPSNTVTGTDPRLGPMGGDYRSTLTVRDLATTVGASYFIPAGGLVLPYAGAGLQVHQVKSTQKATTTSGVALGQHTESGGRVGGALFGGAGLRLGPGLLLGELRFGYTPIAQRVTGDSNIGALSLLLGYGLLL